ncbi:hypothetical protein DTL42_24155 [Bremerella cremea]|uniref:Uncharacterized protein n=1 Tax=Bremerella cremea TaxID=1031537 RepID=A0A368KIU7_9BACT|nr:hypothetical protein [Bremerella cremea]RCS40472.1 hypothetical protein DTL42_24155 [Bremerella cremea]
MLLSSCPRCHDSIRIPASAQSHSIVRCPRCCEEFPLNEILDQLPPEAEIVSGPGSQEHTVMPTSLADATEYVLAGEETKPAVPDFRFKETGSLRPDMPPMAKIDSSRPSRKPKRPEPNLGLEFVKVVVGGIVGLGLAVMAIIWTMHRDPLGIAHKLPVQAYMILPEKMRTDEMKKYARGEAPAATPEEDEEEIELTVEKISIEKFPVDEEPADLAPLNEPPVAEPLTFEPPMTELPLAEPALKNPRLETPPVDPRVANEPLQPMAPTAEDQASNPNAPPTLSLAEEVSMATEATNLLGEIGAQIPEPPGAEPTPPTNVGNVDLSPVDDGEN